MPNHVINVLEFTGSDEDIKELMAKIKPMKGEFGWDYEPSEDECIDFNQIIPMPDSIRNTESSSAASYGIIVYLTNRLFDKLPGNVTKYLYNEDIANDYYERAKNEDFSDEEIEKLYKIGKKLCDNQDKYGCKDWYDWSCRYWGTKWNAYSQSKLLDNKIEFSTAWCAPFEVICTLSEVFPEVEIRHTYADEDLGSNCGEIVWLEGNEIETMIFSDDREAYEFACRAWGLLPDWDDEESDSL